MATFNWIHISDLHWRAKTSYEESVVLKALIQDVRDRVKNISPELAEIHCIFVTGDMAWISDSKEYGQAQQFFRGLCEAAGVEKEHLYVVPGNHDVDRGAATASQPLINALTDEDKIGTILSGAKPDDATHRVEVMGRLHNYGEFVNMELSHQRFSAEQYYYVDAGLLDGRVAVLGLNTVWTSASDEDQHKLLMGECQVREATDKIRHTDLRIALMHHPLHEWLRPDDGQACRELLLEHCDFILHGHDHILRIESAESYGKRTYVISEGAAFAHDTNYFVYSLVHMNLRSRKGKAYLRMYTPARGGWFVVDALSFPHVYRPGEHPLELDSSRRK